MSELVRWLFQQGGTVVVLLMGFGFFFRFIVPAFRQIEEKHERALQEQISDHRTLRATDREQYLKTIEQIASAHQTTVEKLVTGFEVAVANIVRSVNELATRIERRADAADRRDANWRDSHPQGDS